MVWQYVIWMLGKRLHCEMRCDDDGEHEWIEFNVTTWKRYRELRRYYRGLGFR